MCKVYEKKRLLPSQRITTESVAQINIRLKITITANICPLLSCCVIWSVVFVLIENASMFAVDTLFNMSVSETILNVCIGVAVVTYPVALLPILENLVFLVAVVEVVVIILVYPTVVDGLVPAIIKSMYFTKRVSAIK